MNDFIFFLGRFHVLALHLPIGILLLTVALDLLSRNSRHSYLVQALPLCWAATTITAMVTVVLGLMHFSEGGFDGATASAHRNYGISVAVISLVVWYLAARRQSLYLLVRLFSNAVLLFLVTMTGHYGGNLTHGSTYLVEYAPAPLRALAGLPTRRPTPIDVGAADPWHDVVRPLLQARCLSCHNEDKRRGELDLSSLDGLLAGGENGPVVATGNAAGSDLYRRITLPQDHEDVMPAEGKTALTEAQIRILGWWIDAGMPVDTEISQLGIENIVVELLAAELGLATTGTASEAAPYPEIPLEALEQLTTKGWLVRLQSQQSNGLFVSLYSPRQEVPPEMLETLISASPSIVDLDLAGTGLDDVTLGLIGNMPVLETLNLGDNEITDESMTLVAGFQSLHVLNLHGNSGVTDAGLAQLFPLSNLQSLYLWRTGTSPAGIAALRLALPRLTIHDGSSISELESTE